MCKGLSSLPSSCLEKAKGMRIRLTMQEWTHQKPKSLEENGTQDLDVVLSSKSKRKTNTSSLPLCCGLHEFRCFLRSEFSEENLEFWLACEDYRVSPRWTQSAKASHIYDQFINPDAPHEVNLDAQTREAVLSAMDSPSADSFDQAQQRIYNLMVKDSFPRFLRSPHCMAFRNIP